MDNHLCGLGGEAQISDHGFARKNAGKPLKNVREN